MKTTHFKINGKACFMALLLLTGTVFTSCKNEKNREVNTNPEVQNDTVAAVQNDKGTDTAFLSEAATVNMEEIELGLLAQKRSSSNEVKDFGKMMVDGHTKSFSELKELAGKEGIALPQQVSEKGQNTIKELTGADAENFDKMYISKMVDGHKETIAKFENARDNAADADVKAWAVKTLPDLQMHLDHAIKVQQKIK